MVECATLTSISGSCALDFDFGVKPDGEDVGRGRFFADIVGVLVNIASYEQ